MFPSFSQRFAFESHEASPLWQARTARLAAGLPVLDLTLSNPTVAGIDYPASLPALLARPEILHYRPSPRGLLSARQAVAAYLRTLGTAPGQTRNIDPEDILLTASTSEAYGFLFKLLCDPGDELLIPTPTYPLFDSLATLDHVELVRYPLRLQPGPGAARWTPDFASLRKVVSTRTKALILVSPNNPTGHMAGPGEIRAYLELAKDYGLALIVDEVFSEYVLGPERAYRAIESDGPLVFTLNGLSKLAGLPQLKLGWIHAAGDKVRVRTSLRHLEWIADAYLSVNTPVQEACADILALAPSLQAPILARLRANVDAARSLLASAPSFRLLLPEAGWSLVLSVSIPPGQPADDEAFALKLLAVKGVYVHPGHLFGFEEGGQTLSVVLSLLTPEEDFRRGLSDLIAFRENQKHG